MELVRYYKKGWHVAYLEELTKRPKGDIATLVPVIAGKKKIHIAASEIERIEYLKSTGIIKRIEEPSCKPKP